MAPLRTVHPEAPVSEAEPSHKGRSSYDDTLGMRTRGPQIEWLVLRKKGSGFGRFFILEDEQR